MQKLLIKGKKDLSGSISISGSKNATLPILAASILAKKSKAYKCSLSKRYFYYA
jgi:UDP-N-acetylglucosamine 1-carboxyvinyltransferase